jgi:peptidoglycan endopeptidase LytF
MDRKKTILIAVIINAGLLALLFIVALHREDAGAKNIAAAPVAQEIQQPLFSDLPALSENPTSRSVTGSTELISPSVVASAPLEAQNEIIHSLPPLALQEEASPIAPVAVPAAPMILSAADNEIRVKKGDSLEKIAKAYHTTVDEVIRLNHLPSSFLRVGQLLKIPINATAPMAATKQKVAQPSTANRPEYYVVRVGDNPWTIATKHHMKVDELLKVNNLNEEKARRLKPGDRIRIR